MNIYEKLSLIQSEVKATKDRRNDFGGFSYRSAEDILEAVKPICKEHKTVLVLHDEICMIGDRYYVVATATLTNTEKSEEAISAVAYARECLSRPKMDEAQLTGSASSYARKYALNGLFNLDDNKDADDPGYTKAMMDAKKEEAAEKIKAQEQADLPISQEEEAKLVELVKAFKAKAPYEERVSALCKKYGVEDFADLKKSQYVKICRELSK